MLPNSRVDQLGLSAMSCVINEAVNSCADSTTTACNGMHEPTGMSDKVLLENSRGLSGLGGVVDCAE